jgi:hypothetical protein
MTTFILRMTTDAKGGLHGTVCRVSTAETRAFSSGAQLTAFLEEWNGPEGLRTESVECAATNDEVCLPVPPRGRGSV